MRNDLLLSTTQRGIFEDYKIDIEAYWRRSVDLSSMRMLTVVKAEPPSRMVSAWHGTTFYMIAETSDEVKKWMEHRHGPDKSRGVHGAGFIWLRNLPTPEQYPRTVRDLMELLKTDLTDGTPIVDEILKKGAWVCSDTFSAGGNPEGRPIIVAVRLRQPEGQAAPGQLGVAETSRGFRPGRVPPQILALRYRMQRSEVTRADGAKSRLPLQISAALEDKTVAILGCGSLGSTVARQLLQSGVGKLILIDPDTLGWQNIGRHELGAQSVDQNKATALGEHLRSRFPHVRSIDTFDRNWMICISVDA